MSDLKRSAEKKMRGEAIQKYSVMAAYVGFPIAMLASIGGGARPTFLVWFGGACLAIFGCSVAATLLSGVAYGKGFERFERKKRPGAFWSLVATQVVQCGVLIYAVIRGLSGAHGP